MLHFDKSEEVFLNLKKCELIFRSQLLPCQSSLFSPDLVRLVENFEILGVPIGSEKFCVEDYVKRKCSSSAFRAIEAISFLDNPQVSAMLLPLCAFYFNQAKLL